MFGKEAEVPLDLLLNQTTAAVEHTNWVIEHVERLREAHRRAGERMKRKADEKLPSRLVQKGETVRKNVHFCVCVES